MLSIRNDVQQYRILRMEMKAIRLWTLKNKFVNLQIKTDILMIQKRFIYMCKVACELSNTRLICQFKNTHYSVYFVDNTLSC